jgi:hypothetical protein
VLGEVSDRAMPMRSNQKDVQPDSSRSSDISRLQVLEASEQLKRLVISFSTAPPPAVPRLHTGQSSTMAGRSIDIDKNPGPKETTSTSGVVTGPGPPAAGVPQLPTGLLLPLADASIANEDSLAPNSTSASAGDTEPSSPVADVPQIRAGLSLATAETYTEVQKSSGQDVESQGQDLERRCTPNPDNRKNSPVKHL